MQNSNPQKAWASSPKCCKREMHQYSNLIEWTVMCVHMCVLSDHVCWVWYCLQECILQSYVGIQWTSRLRQLCEGLLLSIYHLELEVVRDIWKYWRVSVVWGSCTPPRRSTRDREILLTVCDNRVRVRLRSAPGTSASSQVVVWWQVRWAPCQPTVIILSIILSWKFL